ncbi:MAG: MiaB/RimO family radical SAM methylthiotransferase, partial [Clostridia bacterium]|nr:MiaB/RimO family radical SAM methylthiotransferase [Clostridia bacterium]
KSRQMLRRFRKLNPGAVMVLTGCMPQAFPKESSLLLEADIVAGNTDPKQLPDLVEQFMRDGERIVFVGEHTRDEKFNTPAISEFSEHTRAFMKIQDGCDRYCTYCIIPTARGNIRSRSLNDIRLEAENLAKAGFPEVVLVGINLTSFGRDTGHNLCDAVDTVAAVDGIKRIRLGSLEPDHISDETLERLSRVDKFCPQFHLSLQSGSDKTLKRMNRHYDSAFYYDLVTRIRNKFPSAAITTDIMVGFAGETEEEFKENIEFAKKVGFALTHVFAYSRRAGTVAHGLPNQVTKAEKEKRSRQMIAATKLSEQNFLNKQCGTTVSVLFETADNNIYSGYTKNYTYVKVKSDNNLCGKIADVKLLSCHDGYCEGELI